MIAPGLSFDDKSYGDIVLYFGFAATIDMMIVDLGWEKWPRGLFYMKEKEALFSEMKNRDNKER